MSDLNRVTLSVLTIGADLDGSPRQCSTFSKDWQCIPSADQGCAGSERALQRLPRRNGVGRCDGASPSTRQAVTTV
jgi:hypothetical protein